MPRRRHNPFKSWAEKQDGYSDCKWCKGRGCTFCPGEEAKAAKRAEERALRMWEQSGFYKDPDFQYWNWGEVIFYTFENDRTNEHRDPRDKEILKFEIFQM